PVGADAKEPGGKAAGDLRRSGDRDPGDAADIRRKRQVEDLFDHSFRLPEDPGGAASEAQLSGKSGTTGPVGGGDRFSESGEEPEEGSGGPGQGSDGRGSGA